MLNTRGVGEKAVSVLHLLHHGKPLLHQPSLQCVTVKYNRSVLHLATDLSVVETLVRIVAATHPWLVCRIMGAIV